MEVGSCSSAEKMMWACSIMESVVAETVVAASKFLACILWMTGPLLNDIDGLPKLTPIEKSFSLDELCKTKRPDPDLKDARRVDSVDDLSA
ncbi:hypothetical protein JRO89_XS03G0283900 [Xanthoceras sorbifolium]|uniref:Uncharacterized protein n=1 Tax=Xanthoceras sorbifolium TaxID=99658 RepID=A0ABQ8ICE8_9ROSI|nr:hypothetical protein JRO89_XS03G0283900 [Xanthoceras sorbifolium]